MELFPINIATGKAFCNRVSERNALKQYILKGRHTVIIAPRRYGKTSLINQVLLELGLPFTIIELTMATTVKQVEQMLIKHISDLLHSILPKTTKSKQAILKLFKWLNPELVLTAAGQKLIFHPEWKKSDGISNISEALKKLDEAATLVKRRVVVVMDEFQQLAEIEDHTVEATVRNAMQYSKSTSYVFSGSHRHMLISMFNSKNRPFYNSCEVFTIDRITQADYVKFIQKAAKEKWGKPIEDTALKAIFELTEMHPSYINRICGHFWLIDKYPTGSAIHLYWQSFVQSKRSELAEDILSLSKNQRRVLTYLAQHLVNQPSNIEVVKETELPEPSIRQAIKVLMLKDYIYKDHENNFRILDPALKAYIKHVTKM